MAESSGVSSGVNEAGKAWITKGMKLLAQNGFSAGETDKSIQPVINLVRATQTDVPTAAPIAKTPDLEPIR